MASDRTERRLAAIMFTDIVGYTTLMAESEERGLRVRERHRSVLRRLAEQHHGQIVDENGDELVLSFPSALDAVNCALAAQTELRDDSELRLRIGVHLGDVVFEEARIYGDGVNVASRIRPLAGPGGICVSDEVYRSIRNQTDIEAIALGRQELKNVGQPIEVYAVGRPGEVTAPVLHAPATLLKRVLAVVAIAALLALGVWGWNRTVLAPRSSGPIRSIAVLPLENLGSPEQEYVADGVTDALIESLARVGPELRVISRTSVMQYKGRTKSSREIADELGVEFLIEGTAQRQDDRVLIRVQLIEAREDAHLWAQSYERDLRDFFSVQREIARTVAAEVHVALKPEREPLLAATRPVDPEALDFYLRAVSLRGPTTLVASWGPPAIELLERSVALDPDFAEGWVELAWAHGHLGDVGLGSGSRDDFVRAREAAQRALELDERLGAAHNVLGHVRLYYDWDFSGARSAFERAAELSPSDPRALNGLRLYLLIVGLGKSPEAELLLERLLRVAPLDLYGRTQRMWHFLFTREYERGIAEVERIREFAPEFVDVYIASLYFRLGRPEDAVREMLAFFERGGAAFDAQREAFQRGSEGGGREGCGPGDA